MEKESFNMKQRSGSTDLTAEPLHCYQVYSTSINLGCTGQYGRTQLTPSTQTAKQKGHFDSRAGFPGDSFI